MLQGSPHIIHFKRILDFGEGQAFQSISNLPKPFYNSALYNRFYENLVQGRPNDWHCHAGSRYLYVCDDGLVNYCSQQRGYPGIPLLEYTHEDLRREYTSVKPCAPYCSIPCVQRVAMVDEFREEPREALARFFPAREDSGKTSCDLPASIHILTWLFLPRNQDGWRRHLASAFTRAALSCLRVK